MKYLPRGTTGASKLTHTQQEWLFEQWPKRKFSKSYIGRALGIAPMSAEKYYLQLLELNPQETA